MDKLDLDALDETAFEAFCFDLLRELGFINLDWRKGTPLRASPADRGRDIVCELDRTDVDGARHVETWFVDCKHYKRGVPPEKIQGLLAWAQAERPHTALVIASGFLSNATKDYLRDYEEKNRPPFRIKYWERPTLERLTEGRDEFLARHLLTGMMRTESEVIDAEQEFFDRVWYGRKPLDEELERIAAGEEQPPPHRRWLTPELAKQVLESKARVRAKYGAASDDEFLHADDFAWGMLSGKLSALRWVLGDEWDFLDT